MATIAWGLEHKADLETLTVGKDRYYYTTLIGSPHNNTLNLDLCDHALLYRCMLDYVNTHRNVIVSIRLL